MLRKDFDFQEPRRCIDSALQQAHDALKRKIARLELDRVACAARLADSIKAVAELPARIDEIDAELRTFQALTPRTALIALLEPLEPTP